MLSMARPWAQGLVYIPIFLHPAQEALPSLCHMEGSHPNQLLGPLFIDSETEQGPWSLSLSIGT